MIDLDEYINKTVDMKIGKEVVRVKLPSCNAMAEVARVEDFKVPEDVAEYYKSRQKIAQIFLNANADNRIFTDEELDTIPNIAIEEIIKAVTKARNEVMLDPNSGSQSQKETSVTPS